MRGAAGGWGLGAAGGGGLLESRPRASSVRLVCSSGQVQACWAGAVCKAHQPGMRPRSTTSWWRAPSRKSGRLSVTPPSTKRPAMRGKVSCSGQAGFRPPLLPPRLAGCSQSASHRGDGVPQESPADGVKSGSYDRPRRERLLLLDGPECALLQPVIALAPGPAPPPETPCSRIQSGSPAGGGEEAGQGNEAWHVKRAAPSCVRGRERLPQPSQSPAHARGGQPQSLPQSPRAECCPFVANAAPPSGPAKLRVW